MIIKRVFKPLFCILILTTASFTQTKIFNLDELAGTYFTGNEFGGSRFQLSADGDYKNTGYTESSIFSEFGKYVFGSGVLKFRVLKSSEKNISDEKEINLLDPSKNKDAAKEPRNYVLLPIRWRTRIYLIPEREVMEFINAVNLSVEPRENTDSKFYLGNFYLQDKTYKNLDFHSPIFPVKGLPELPEEWVSFLLVNTVTAKVIKIEGEGKRKIAVIDKGIDDGLKIGMRLISKNERPSLWSGVEILSSEPKTAKVRVLGELKIGEQLSSKYVHKNLLPFSN